MRIVKRNDLPSNAEVRLVGKDLNKIVSRDEVFREAENQELDVVCVSDQANPWVVRIEDYNKLEYERKKSKKAQKAKSKASGGGLKEVQFKIRIADHDLEIKVNRVKGFLERGDKVKASVRLRGREKANPAAAKELIQRVADMAGAKIQQGGPPHVSILEADDS